MLNYADYAFYIEVYKGKLNQEEFDRNIIKACAYVRRITFGRADQYADLEEVKCAACAVCEIYAEDAKKRSAHNGMNIASESNDGYSVSFAQEQLTGETAESLLKRKAYEAAETFLMPTGLLSWEV